MTKRILITAANGHTGYTTAMACLALGHQVRAMVRNIDSSTAQNLKMAGAELFRGNMDDYRDVAKALEAMDRAYFCAPFDRGTLNKSINFIVAAEKAKLEHVVYMIQWLLSPAHPAANTREQWLARQVCQLHGNVGCTFINTGIFGFTYFFTMEMVTQLGIYPTLLSKDQLNQVGLNAPPSEEDQGRVIAQILHDPGVHKDKTYRITGPRLISHLDVIRTYEKVLGRQVKPMTVSKRMLLKSLKAMGFPLYQIGNLAHYLDEMEAGVFALDGGVTSVVEKITGQAPEDLETIVRRELDQSGLKRRTIGSRLKALRFFIRMMMTSTPDLPGYEKQQAFPSFFNPTLYAYMNSEWRSEHQLSRFDLT